MGLFAECDWICIFALSCIDLLYLVDELRSSDVYGGIDLACRHGYIIMVMVMKMTKMTYPPTSLNSAGVRYQNTIPSLIPTCHCRMLRPQRWRLRWSSSSCHSLSNRLVYSGLEPQGPRVQGERFGSFVMEGNGLGWMHGRWAAEERGRRE